MKAILNGLVVAESTDIVEHDGYADFPRAAVRTQFLAKAEKTVSDHACPHGVQFYDVVIDGARHLRAAWSYEGTHPVTTAGRPSYAARAVAAVRQCQGSNSATRFAG